MKNKHKEILNLTLNIAIIFLIFCNISILIFKIDFTKNKAFTISKVTKDLFSNANEKIYITYYNSASLGNYFAFPEQIKNFLTSFADSSSGKVIYRDIDADKLTTPLEQIGIPAQQIDLREINQLSILKIYSGIEINYEGKREVLPIVTEISNLEYDLASTLDKLINNTKKVLGLVFGDTKLKATHKNFTEIMQKAFKTEIKEINISNEQLKDINGLFIIGSKEINEGVLKKIDEFIVNNGRVLIATSKIDYNPQNPYNTNPIKSEIFNLIESYGIKYNDNIILDKRAPSLFLGGNFQTYYPWILIDKSNIIDPNNPLLKNFYDAIIPWSNSIELIETKNNGEIKYLPLFASSKESWQVSDEEVASIAMHSFSVPKTFNKEDKQNILGYSIEGQMKSLYKDKKSENSKIILLGSSMIFSDYMYNGSPSNFELAGRISDYLMQKEAFFSIKSRELRSKLKFINSSKEMLNAKFSLIIINLIILPIAIIIFGLIRFTKKRKIN
ncbi:Gldg family protein [Borrelia coriaceae]|uniref:Exported protein n=1 Tax=Borrelia coriaceae ATCC 43381 TaxID=1408429 RepID=W5SVJ0_9SPIR|nr:Gldg family protein [Borrelia coriaceae]AHH10945.1 Putative exported protein [Borrelia coriaceae ATCC 43381]UPA16595.1 Gldg family protein [Borrelia coriaceae]